jgi:hypothetical protein
MVAIAAISIPALGAYSLVGADQYVGFNWDYDDDTLPVAGARINDTDDPEFSTVTAYAVDAGYEPAYNKGPVYEQVSVGNGWAAAMRPETNENILGLKGSTVADGLTNSMTVYAHFQYTASVVDNYAAFTRLGLFGLDRMFVVNARPSWWAGAGNEYDFLEIMVNDGAPGHVEYGLYQQGGNPIPSVSPNTWYELAITYDRNPGTNMATATSYIRTTGMGTPWSVIATYTKSDATGLYHTPIPAGRTAINPAMFGSADHVNDWWTWRYRTDQGKFESFAIWDVALSENDLNGLVIPEPGSMLLVGISLAALLRKRS